MKRTLLDSPASGDHPDFKMKKVKHQDEDAEVEEDPTQTGFMNLDENLLFEVLKHVDAKTLATVACVNKQWHKTSQDERLWELICTRHCANVGYSNHQLRSVVLPLGGFRRLHANYLSQFLKPPPQSSASISTAASASTSAAASASTSASVSASSNQAPFRKMMTSRQPARWGKDEVHLSLSLLSIRYFERMNSSNRGR